jgi:hypothetical protein
MAMETVCSMVSPQKSLLIEQLPCWMDNGILRPIFDSESIRRIYAQSS